jgi:transketolase
VSTDNTFAWTELDQRAVDTVRALAMDAVEEAGSGHPGTAMSLAPAAYLLFQRLIRNDPTDPDWTGRDRFVLSAGHSSLTLYIQLYLSGYGLTLDDLRALRKWGSLTPGHPEHGHTIGVETTTGPLGQGLGNAVGMAMAARRERGLFDPDTAAGQSPFDHFVYSIASDGDIEEGISHEVSSLAGHQKLGNLIVIYDDNHISIEDDTQIAKSEDVAKRYEAYGWHVQTVDWTAGDGRAGGARDEHYKEDPEALYSALLAAKEETGRPSLIALRTIIGWPAPNAQNTGKVHGAALGADEVAATKRVLGQDPDKTFDVPDDVLEHAREVLEGEGTPTRVVSMPSVEWFEAQDGAYKQQVLPPSVCARVSVEAGLALGWLTYVGEAGESVSLEHFGASADHETLFQQFGFTADRVVAAARASLTKVNATGQGSTT